MTHQPSSIFFPQALPYQDPGLPASPSLPGWPSSLPRWPASDLPPRMPGFPSPGQATPMPRLSPTRLRFNVESHPLVLRVRERLAGLRAQLEAGPKRTHMLFLLDKSRSMLNGRDVTVAGYNDQVDTVREGHVDAGQTTVSLLLFSDHVSVSYAFSPVTQLEHLTNQTYRPDGNTALFDALGRAVDLVLGAKGFEQSNTAFLVASFTDGENNVCNECDGAVIAKCIELLEATGRVTFTFMGPKEGLQSMADVLALAPGNVSGYDASTVEGRTEAFASMSGATASYMSLRSQGVTASRSLYSDISLSAPPTDDIG